MKAGPFEQVMDFLPFSLQDSLLKLDKEKQAGAEEIRLRVGSPIRVVLGCKDLCVAPERALTPDDLHTVLELASEHSVHTALERMRGGFITVRGGHRIGICGEATVDRGKIMGFRSVSSLNLRIAREIKGAAKGLIPQLLEGDRLQSTLIIAPPGAGKTTLLRDLIRRISSGIETQSRRVGVVDERGELASLWDGRPRLDLGAQTDVLDGISKAEGMLFLLRGMNPQVLAVDEITHPDDIQAVALTAGCGVTVFATIHGMDQQELLLRPVCRELAKQNVFRRAVQIERGSTGERGWKVEEIKW